MVDLVGSAQLDGVVRSCGRGEEPVRVEVAAPYAALHQVGDLIGRQP
jgi:hypothetical protein